MDEGALGIVVLLAISLVCAVVANAVSPRLLKAGIYAALCASILFQVAVTIHLGYVDPFAPMAFIVGAFVAFVISLAIGGLIRLGRRTES